MMAERKPDPMTPERLAEIEDRAEIACGYALRHPVDELVSTDVFELVAEFRILRAAVDQAGRGAALAARDHRRRAEIESLRSERDAAQAALAAAADMFTRCATEFTYVGATEPAAFADAYAKKIRDRLAATAPLPDA